MAHKSSSNEKVVYVGDSRVKKKSGTAPLPPDYSSYPGKSETFIPNFLLKEWMVGVVALVGILVLTISEPAPLGYPADPNNTGFIPIPDWYFLFLYQLLKYPYASGDYTWIGTVVVPGLAFGGLMLAPFLDTGKERRFYRRPIASSFMLVSLLAVIYLTRVAWVGYQDELKHLNIIPEHIEREEKAHAAHLAGLPTGQPKANAEIALVEPDDPALETMKKAQCLSCHGADLKGGGGGPSLRGIGDTKSQEEILTVLHEGAMKPMYENALKAGVTEDEIVKITEWLAKQKTTE